MKNKSKWDFGDVSRAGMDWAAAPVSSEPGNTPGNQLSQLASASMYSFLPRLAQGGLIKDSGMPLNFSQRLANSTLRIASQLLPQDDLQPRFCGGGIVKRFAGGGSVDDDPTKKMMGFLPNLALVGSARGTQGENE